MAQKVIIIVHCDACLADQTEREGTEVSVALDGGKAAPVALCDEHREKLFDPLADLYFSISGNRRGATKKAASANGAAVKPVEEQTLTCEHCKAVFSTNDGLKRPAMALSLHVKKEHPEVAAQTTEATNDEPPVAPPAKAAKKATTKKAAAAANA